MDVAKLIPDQRDFWLTRDLVAGKLSLEVHLWIVRPWAQVCADGDVLWLPDLNWVDSEVTLYSTLTLAEAKREVGAAVPATPRECIRVARGHGAV